MSYIVSSLIMTELLDAATQPGRLPATDGLLSSFYMTCT